MHGVVTPYASFLALRYAPHEALANLRALTEEFPMIYGPLGFQDSVDVSCGNSLSVRPDRRPGHDHGGDRQ